MSKYSHKTKRIYTDEQTEIEQPSTEVTQEQPSVTEAPLDLSDTVSIMERTEGHISDEEAHQLDEETTIQDEPSNDEPLNVVTTPVTYNGPELEDTGKVDLSDTQPLPVIVKEVHVGEHKPMPKWIPYLGALLGILVAICGTIIYQVVANQHPQEDVKVTATTKSNQTDLKTFTANLKKTADATGTPYKVTTETIGGGYIVGVTTYNPDTATDMYMDYALAKPAKAQKQADDDTAKSIQENLKKDLPTINKSIKVKDKEKVSMETYKVGDLYHTILLYDNQPFAYVVTDKDGVSTNYVTAYYVTNVAAE